MLWEHEPQAGVSMEYTFSISFRKHRDKVKGNNLLTLLTKCKFSLLTPSLHQQRVLVLCLHRVKIRTRAGFNKILTNYISEKSLINGVYDKNIV